MVNKKLRVLRSLMVLIILTLFVSPGVGLASQNQTNLQTPNLNPPNSPVVTYNLYLPLMTSVPKKLFIIGAEMYTGASPDYTSKAVAANIRWARTSVLAWDMIEPTRTNPPTYLWSGNVNESNLKGLSASGITAIAMVRWTPSWAQKTPPYVCGPVAENALDAFAQFMTAAVQRYSQPPYNVHYWEIGNEPDAPFVGDNRNVFGCWGDPTLPFYGGGYYAKALEKVYPAIKAADPNAQVVIGGLLLDCDPNNPPPGKDCSPGNFFEGILDNNGKKNGANYFDIVGFHGYTIYSGGTAGLQGDENNPSWAHLGGVVLGKANFLRQVMNKYGVNKPIYASEGALTWYPQYAPPQDFFEAQADYVVWLFVRNVANGIHATSWYTYEGNGWRYSSLLDDKGSPKPVYYALQFMANELSGTNYNKQITAYPGVRIYEFGNSLKKIWVMWTPDQQNYTISLPAGTIRVLDKYGTVIQVSGNQLTVNTPVYVEITP